MLDRVLNTTLLWTAALETKMNVVATIKTGICEECRRHKEDTFLWTTSSLKNSFQY